MATLIDCLHQYAQEEQMAAVLSAAGPDFRTARHLAEKVQTELEGLLKGREAQLFSAYLDNRDQVELEEDLAIFRCGLSVGLELGRL